MTWQDRTNSCARSLIAGLQPRATRFRLFIQSNATGMRNLHFRFQAAIPDQKSRLALENSLNLGWLVRARSPGLF